MALDRLSGVGATFAVLGRVSLAIMFLHLSFYYNLVRYMPEREVFLIEIAGSWLLAAVAARSRLMSALFLGRHRRQPEPTAAASTNVRAFGNDLNGASTAGSTAYDQAADTLLHLPGQLTIAPDNQM